MPPGASLVNSTSSSRRRRNASSTLGGDLPRPDDGGVEEVGADGRPLPLAYYDRILSLGVARARFLAVLRLRAARARKCRSLPLAVALYGAFLGSLVLRASNPEAFDVERGLADTLVADFFPTTPLAWADWLTATFLPAALPGQVRDQGAGRAEVPGGGVALGGVRITQRRARATECSFPSPSFPASILPWDSASGGGACRSRSWDAASPAPFAPNASQDAEALAPGLALAFEPAVVPGDPSGPGFHYFVSVYEPESSSSSSVSSLVASSAWLDGYTADLQVGAAFLYPSAGRVALVRLDAEVLSGGRVAYVGSVRSVPLDPYVASPGLGALDAVVLAYLAYLVLSSLRRTARWALSVGESGGCCARRSNSAAAADAGASLSAAELQRRLRKQGKLGPDSAAPPPPFRSFRAVQRELPGFPSGTAPPLASPGPGERSIAFALRLLDWACVFSLGAAVATWIGFAEELARARTALATSLPAPPDVDPPPADPTFPPAWSGALQTVSAAVSAHNSFKTAAVWALILLTVRVFKYAAFQPRVAIFSVTLVQSLSDMAHMALPFTVLFVAFGVWARFSFGSQMESYATDARSAVSSIETVMYGYDLAAMRSADGGGTTDLFFSAFMLLMTNLMLWLFLAVVFDTYSVVRTAAGSLPSLVEEALGFLQALPAMVPACPGSGKGRGAGGEKGSCFRCCCPTRRSTIAWSDAIAACITGSLKAAETVRAQHLAIALGCDPPAAALLVADAYFSPLAPVASHYGVGTAGASPLPRGMRAALALRFPGAFPQFERDAREVVEEEGERDYAVWTVVSAGYGALYTVQVSQMRLLADRSIAAAYSGLCMGTLALAAATGTYAGGLISEHIGGVKGYEACYLGGAITSLIGILFIPWITAEDPEMRMLKARQRAERKKAAGGRLRRRSSFAAWVARARGKDGAAELQRQEEIDAALAERLLDTVSGAPSSSSSAAVEAGGEEATLSPLEAARRVAALQPPTAAALHAGAAIPSRAQRVAAAAIAASATTASMLPGTPVSASPSPVADATRPLLRRPALGSMKNLLEATDAEAASSFSARARKAARSLFDDSGAAVTSAVRRLSRSVSRRASRAPGIEWGTSSSSSTGGAEGAEVAAGWGLSGSGDTGAR
jgi:hypothetical protein